MTHHKMDRAVEGEVIVDAPIEQAWQAWTTPEGAVSFFAPRCTIDLRPGGKYEMLFDRNALPGKQGGEGVIVLALQPPAMLSLTWNAPPEIPDIRAQRTHVTVRLEAVGSNRTKVTLRHDGWGDGAGWDAAFDYFDRAWNQIVLPRLQYRFEHGPVDWANPPDLTRFQPD